MINKKGLSGIITTLIIILLVLAAIAIVWTPIKNLLTSSTENLNTVCFDTQVDILSVTPSGPNNLDVIIERNSKGPKTGVNVKAMAYSESGTGDSATLSDDIKPLQRATISVPQVSGNNSVRVYVTYTNDAGETKVCDNPSTYTF